MAQKPKDIFTRYPVSSFSPELMDILLKGTRERVEIPCPDQKTMQHLQARIHSLRAAMRRESHPQYTVVTRARTTRTWEPGHPDSQCVLVIQPNDAQFTEIFKKAGIKATQHTRDILSDLDLPIATEVETEVESPPIDPYAKFKED